MRSISLTNCVKISCSLIFLSTSSAEAQSEDSPTYMSWGAVNALSQNLQLNLIDDVSDNCWTNASLVRSSAFLALEQNNIFVPGYEVAFKTHVTPQADISAFGFRTNTGLCVVSAELSVWFETSDVLGGVDGKERFSFPIIVQIFEQSAVFVHPSNVNDQLKDFYEAEFSEFIARRISMRRSNEVSRYLETYPPTEERPMSEEQFQQYLENFQ